MKKLIILGSTGSIGKNTLDVVSRFPDEFEVIGLSCGSNISELLDQIKKFHPRIVCVKDKNASIELRSVIKNDIQIVYGTTGLLELASYEEGNFLLNALVGYLGLAPTLAAIQSGKNVATANKETLVCAGHFIMQEARTHKVKVFPIDSEHSAIFQSLQGNEQKAVAKIILTASGGPFLHHSLEQLQSVTQQEALNHPNWKMGKKITIDSATMMNKGLEVIEARWLFEISKEKIEVVIHPQSIIHSMVEYVDRSVIAQLGLPDMRTPILYALTYPKRNVLPLESLDLTKIQNLTFYKPDFEKFRCLQLAYEVLEAGDSYPIVFNVSNEIAVHAFLDTKIRFLDISKTIEKLLNIHTKTQITTIEDVFCVIDWTKKKTEELLTR